MFLADELNRTSSRTQAALLEAMEERQVTVDGHSYQLENPFSVIATQNPVGASGTQLLPDSQTDRFTVRISMGYPNFEAECQMLINRSRQNPLDKVKQAVTVEELINMQNKLNHVFEPDHMEKYIEMPLTATTPNPHLKEVQVQEPHFHLKIWQRRRHLRTTEITLFPVTFKIFLLLP